MTREPSYDPLGIFADKLSTIQHQCDDRHRRVEHQFQQLQAGMAEFNRTIHGESGDNGLKSLLVRNIAQTDALKTQLERLSSKLEGVDIRSWKLLLYVAGAGTAGGLLSQLINL